MTPKLLLKLCFGNDFVIDVDIAVFPCSFSLRDFPADTSPVILSSILPHAPIFEVPFVLCFAGLESTFMTAGVFSTSDILHLLTNP